MPAGAHGVALRPLPRVGRAEIPGAMAVQLYTDGRDDLVQVTHRRCATSALQTLPSGTLSPSEDDPSGGPLGLAWAPVLYRLPRPRAH